MRIALTLALFVVLAAAQPVPDKEARHAFEKGEAAARVRHFDEAIRDYREAVTLFPAYAEAWYEMGKLQLEQKQSNDAGTAFDAAIKADPKYPAPYLLLATIEYAAGDWPKLIDLTDRLLRLDAIDYPQAWLLNAVGHYNTRELGAAEKSVREAEQIDPRRQFPGTWRLLGQILAQRGDYSGAVEQFREYLKAAPSAPDSDAVRAKLADVEKRAGTTSEPDTTPTFVSDINLAVVRFRFRQNKGEAPRQLTPEDVEIREDGVDRKPALFSSLRAGTNAVPVEISLLFDCSASVDRIAVADPNIFRESLLDQFPNLSIAIYGFSDSLVRLVPPTRDVNALKKAMGLIAAIPARDTPLFGSITDTLRDMGVTGPNVIRMLVVFSDGESSSSVDVARASEAARAAEKSGAALFPVMLDKPASQATDSVESVSEFVKLATESGGKAFQGMMGTDVLPTILKAVAHEMQDDYVAGFYLSRYSKPKTRQIKVVLHSGVRGKLNGGTRVIVY